MLGRVRIARIPSCDPAKSCPRRSVTFIWTSPSEGTMALIEFDDVNHAKILVIGVGGGGGNAVNTMISGNLDGVEFVVANTDMQALEANMAPHKIQLGDALTKGLGAGANPEIGRRSADASM